MEKDVLKPEEYIYYLIKDKIAKRELFPKCQIVEAQLVDETGISRTPIRHALKKLNYEGIVDLIPNRGAFVANATLDEVISVYECKKTLEAAAIEKACINMTDQDLIILEELINNTIEVHRKKELYNFISFNEKFHMTIARASKNKYYEKFISELIEKSNVYLIFYDPFMPIVTDESEAIKAHYNILDALKSKNVNTCIEAIIIHNQITLDRLNLNGIV